MREILKMKLRAAELRGIKRNSSVAEYRPSLLAKGSELRSGYSPRLHPRSKLRGIRRRRIKLRGFSTVEIIVTLAIALIALLIVSEVVIAHNTLYRSFSNQTEVNRGATLPLERMRTAVMGARRVVESRTIGGTLYQSGKETVILELPGVDASQNLIPTASDYLVITRDAADPTKIYTIGEIATSSVRNGAKTYFASLVENARFRYNDVIPASASLVHVTLITSRSAAPTVPRSAAGMTFSIRNK